MTSADPPTFYHGSMRELDDGLVLRPTGNASQHHRRERFLEMARPRDRLSRTGCVYLVHDPADVVLATDIRPEHVYEVRPLGGVERSNLHWFDLLADVDAMDDDEFEWIGEYARHETLRQFARNYWNGVEPPEGGVWEYRCGAAEVVGEFVPEDPAPFRR